MMVTLDIYTWKLFYVWNGKSRTLQTRNRSDSHTARAETGRKHEAVSAFSPPHYRALLQPVPGPNPDSTTATSTTRETTTGGKGKRMEINWNSVVYSQ